MPQTMISKGIVRGTASGVLFMAFFGTAWAGIGIGGLQGWGTPWLLILAVCIGIVLFIGGIILFRSSSDLSNEIDETAAGRSRRKRISLGFNLTSGVEFALIAIAGAIFGSAGHFEYFFPVMALIVGVHFFPLAYLFQVKIHYVAGILLCLLALTTLFFVPLKTTVGQHEIIAWWSSVGFGSALILWVTGITIWLRGRRLIALSRKG
ncbi:MAG TPA: hypothetical protein VFK33_11960 [Bacillales bacterium]|nr:hypothetical protein [Bacillales bacterium]